MSNCVIEVTTDCTATGPPENINYKNTEHYFVRCVPERFYVAGNSFLLGYSTPPNNLWGALNWVDTVDQWYSSIDEFDSNNVSPYV